MRRIAPKKVIASWILGLKWLGNWPWGLKMKIGFQIFAPKLIDVQKFISSIP